MVQHSNPSRCLPCLFGSSNGFLKGASSLADWIDVSSGAGGNALSFQYYSGEIVTVVVSKNAVGRLTKGFGWFAWDRVFRA